MYGIQIYDKASVEAVLNFWPNSRLAVLLEEVVIKKVCMKATHLFEAKTV